MKSITGIVSEEFFVRLRGIRPTRAKQGLTSNNGWPSGLEHCLER